MPEYKILTERQLRDKIARLPKYQIGRGLSIKQILSKVWALDLANSKYVTVYKVKPLKGKQGYQFYTITREPGKGARKHTMFVYAADARYDGPLYKCPKVKVGCDCVTGDTRVLTVDGYKTIYELMYSKEKHISYVVDGRVFISNKPFYKGRKPVWRLYLSNGNRLEATKDHKVLVYRGTRLKNCDLYSDNGRLCFDWVEVKDLRVGDKLVPSIAKQPKVKKDINYWRSYFAGFFYGDGTCNPWSFTLLDHFENLDTLKKAKFDFTYTGVKGRYLLGRKAKEYLYSLGISRETRHIIPDNVDIYAFLSGLIDTDGRVQDGFISIWGDIGLKKLADKLIELQIQGVKFYKCRDAGTKVNDSYIASKDHYTLSISYFGMQQIKHNLCSNKYKNYVAQKPANNITPVIITGIEYGGNRDVYDITIPEIHTFVAEGVKVHNCERWLFTFEVAMTYHGAANVVFSNGMLPLETNRGLKIGVCKHLIRALVYIVKNKL